jgi:predicted dehydrogenase
MHALKNGLHVMCEKPLAVTYAQADAMATEAARRGVVHCTAFTYNYFPHYQYIRRLIDEGYIGTPYHLNLRYYSTYGLDGAPVWRFDRKQSGEGAVSDIGSHALALALDMMGEITAISARLTAHVTRAGIPAAQRATDAGILTVQFANGASGVIHVSMASFQPKTGGHKQALEISGSNGTLYYHNDFSTTFTLAGAQVGDDAPQPLRVPDDLWPENVSRANPREMYGDLYTKGNAMARDFVGAIVEGRPLAGLTFERGATVQKLIDAAIQSHHDNSRMIEV